MTLCFSFFCEYIPRKFYARWDSLGPLSNKERIERRNSPDTYILNQDSPMMEIWKLVSLSFSCSGMIPKLFLTTTLYIPLSLLVIGLNWSVVRPACSLLYWVWIRPSGKARPSWYHVTVVFSRNRLWNLTVKVKGWLPVISWNGGGWEVMAGGTGGGCWEGREEQKGGEQREEDRVESRNLRREKWGRVARKGKEREQEEKGKEERKKGEEG